MKKYYCIIVYLLMLLSNISGQITRSEAIRIANEYINGTKITKYLLYYYPGTMVPKTEITTFDKKFFSANFNSYAFFIDDNPLQNWSHPCSYLFVDYKTGKTQEIKWNLPPEGLEKWELLTEIKEPQSVKFNFPDKSSAVSLTTSCNVDNSYAVIISGGYDISNNWVRYWNDCSAMYSALTNIYHYKDDHIYVIMADGTNSDNDRRINGGYDSSPLDLDGDGDDDIQYSATRENITTVFNTLSSILGTNDHLFVFTTDHGGQETGRDAIMYLWGQTITDDQFALELNKVNAGETSVVMEQCYSGGFIDDLARPNRTIITACDYNQLSYGMGYYSYDEFAFDWISAIAGKDPYGNRVNADSNSDGFLSIKEAFDYAVKNEASSEVPQYSSNPNAFGLYTTVDGRLKPILTGPSLVCSSYGVPFTISYLTPGASVTWNCETSLLEGTSNQVSNPGTFRAKGSGNAWVQAVINSRGCQYTTPQVLCSAGSPAIMYLGGPTSVQPGSNNPYCAVKDTWNNNATYYWSLSPTGYSGPTSTSENCISFPFPGSGHYTMKVSACNPCGCSLERSLEINSYGYYLTLSPNPSTTETTVSIGTTSKESIDTDPEWNLEVYNQNRQLKARKTKLRGKEFKLNTSGWKEGVYIIQATCKGEVLTEKLVVGKN